MRARFQVSREELIKRDPWCERERRRAAGRLVERSLNEQPRTHDIFSRVIIGRMLNDTIDPSAEECTSLPVSTERLIQGPSAAFHAVISYLVGAPAKGRFYVAELSEEDFDVPPAGKYPRIILARGDRMIEAHPQTFAARALAVEYHPEALGKLGFRYAFYWCVRHTPDVSS